MKSLFPICLLLFFSSCMGVYRPISGPPCLDLSQVEYAETMSIEGVSVPVYVTRRMCQSSVHIESDSNNTYFERLKSKFESIVDTSFGEEVFAMHYLYGKGEDTLNLTTLRGLVVYSEKNAIVMKAQLWELNEQGTVTRFIESSTDVVSSYPISAMKESMGMECAIYGIVGSGRVRPSTGWIIQDWLRRDLKRMNDSIAY